MSVLSFFKKYYVLLNFLVLTVGIFFIAQVMTFQVGKQLRVPLQPAFTPPEVIVKKRESKSFEFYNPIIDRNIFNLRPPVVGANSLEPKVVVPITLLGTVVGVSEEFSYAILEDPYQKVQRIFRLQDTIAPGVELVEISRNQIAILRDGVREEVTVSALEQGGPTRAFAPPQAPQPQSPQALSPEGSGNFLVDKREFDAATQDINRLMTQARLVPNFSGGVPDGFRIFSIVPGSLYEKAGLRNGDIVQNINGVELKDPEKAFQIYQLLKDNDRFTIDLVRAGQKMSLNYEIR